MISLLLSLLLLSSSASCERSEECNSRSWLCIDSQASFLPDQKLDFFGLENAIQVHFDSEIQHVLIDAPDSAIKIISISGIRLKSITLRVSKHLYLSSFCAMMAAKSIVVEQSNVFGLNWEQPCVQQDFRDPFNENSLESSNEALDKLVIRNSSLSFASSAKNVVFDLHSIQKLELIGAILHNVSSIDFANAAHPQAVRLRRVYFGLVDVDVCDDACDLDNGENDDNANIVRFPKSALARAPCHLLTLTLIWLCSPLTSFIAAL